MYFTAEKVYSIVVAKLWVTCSDESANKPCNFSGCNLSLVRQLLERALRLVKQKPNYSLSNTVNSA